VSVRDFRTRDRPADRSAVRGAFRSRHNVGFYLPMLDAEPPPPRTPEARLHFVRDEQPAVVSHDVSNDLEISGRGHDESAGPLDGLAQHGRNGPAGRGLDNFLDIPGAMQFATRIREPVRTPVTIRSRRVNYGLRHQPGLAPVKHAAHGLC